MAIRSRDYVGIAENIKTHELSTKGIIEQLKCRINDLSREKASLIETISYLEAAIAAAYEDTDEDGNPDYGRIAALQAQLCSTEIHFSAVEQELQKTNVELHQNESELQSVLEQKAQTLFEIQQRARTTSRNASIAGGMYGAYSGVSSSLQASMQASFSSLSQAAGILGGSVDSVGVGSGGGVTKNSGDISSKGNSTGFENVSVSGLSAFSVSSTGANGGSARITSQFSTNQAGMVTPASMPIFHSQQASITPHKNPNFSSNQMSDGYVTHCFSVADAPVNSIKSLKSNQESSVSQSNIYADSTVQSRSDAATNKREQFLPRIHCDASSNSATSSSKQSSALSVTSDNSPQGYLVRRTVHELTALIESMELTDGDPAFIQLGGPYSQVQKQLKGSEYEAHHIPPQSVFSEELKNKLPTVAITKVDHGRTSSYRGRMSSKKEPLLPGGPPPQKHKDLVVEALNQGFLAEMVRNEVYEFRRDYGTRYDGGIKQYIEAMIEYVKANGVPATRTF